jgi:hypothetical protein
MKVFRLVADKSFRNHSVYFRRAAHCSKMERSWNLGSSFSGGVGKAPVSTILKETAYFSFLGIG